MLVSLSANHKTTDFAALERLSAAGHGMPQRLKGSHESIRGTVVVSTCNRFEAYFELDEGDHPSPVPAMTAVLDELAEAAGMTSQELRGSLEFEHGNAVAQHLFSVASGLESVVVGEDEIAGQVRRSLEHSRQAGTASPALERLFQRASETSREVKNSAKVGEAGRSIVRLALDLASGRITDWSECRVLLVGTGRYAGASLAALRERGVTDVRVYSVSNRGARFAESHGIPLVHRADYPKEAALAEVIVTCTTANHHVLDSKTLAAGRSALADGPQPRVRRLRAVTEEPGCPGRQLVIDLGLPRNVDPDVAGMPCVELLDLETIRLHAPLNDLETVDEARAIVASATRRFIDAGLVQNVSPSVVALRQHVFDALDSEIARARARENFTPAVEQALRHFAGVVLHQPMVQSRNLAGQGEGQKWIDGIEAVFGIRTDDSATTNTGQRTTEVRAIRL